MKPQAYLVLSGVLVFGLVVGTVCRAEDSPHGGQGYVFAAPGGIVNSEGGSRDAAFWWRRRSIFVTRSRGWR